MTEQIRIGVVGAGIIAQAVHLPYLSELHDKYEIVALCDVATENLVNCATRYSIPKVFTEWPDMLREPMDALLVATSGDHAPIAVAAARAGLHVLVEKPMCFSTREAQAMIDAADQARVTLMVGYNKRYDPAYERFRQEVSSVSDARLLRVTTFESPFLPYIGHYDLGPMAQAPTAVLERLRAEAEESISDALGDADDFLRRTYQFILLDTLVHELNTVRGVLGEPDRIDYVDLRDGAVSAMLHFGGLPVAIHWVDLPGIARYKMEFAVYAPERRITLSFPSPFLRNAPTLLQVEAGDVGTTRSWATEEITSYESSFKRELLAFHECIIGGAQPETSGLDGMRDIALCRALITCFRTGRPVEHPADDARASVA